MRSQSPFQFHCLRYPRTLGGGARPGEAQRGPAVCAGARAQRGRRLGGERARAARRRRKPFQRRPPRLRGTTEITLDVYTRKVVLSVLLAVAVASSPIHLPFLGTALCPR